VSLKELGHSALRYMREFSQIFRSGSVDRADIYRAQLEGERVAWWVERMQTHQATELVRRVLARDPTGGEPLETLDDVLFKKLLSAEHRIDGLSAELNQMRERMAGQRYRDTNTSARLQAQRDLLDKEKARTVELNARAVELKARAVELSERLNTLQNTLHRSGDFMECDTCRAKPGTPELCEGCRNNRALIYSLKNLG
jgi:hypothetical protein